MAENTSSLKSDIRKVTIGTKEPREVTIYPLSLQDQVDLIDTVASFVETFSDKDFEDITTQETLNMIKKMITDNLTLILSYITTDEERPTLRDLTNKQFFEIVEIVFEVNFESVIKNSQDLSQRIKNLIPSK